MTPEELKNELKSYLMKKGKTITSLVTALNEKGKSTTVQNISNKLTRGTINYLEMVEILDTVGYEIKWEEKK